MSFCDHSELIGKHALMSPSKHYWLNYTDEDMEQSYKSSWATAIGTALHDYAKERIQWRLKMNKGERNGVMAHLLRAGIPANVVDLDILYPNLMNYVNEAINYRLMPEIVLAYSYNCFGTADAITDKDTVLSENLLRISDLKTGTTPAHMEQLMIYAALFCLEYKVKPNQIVIELRIYQGGEVEMVTANPEEIWDIMQTIIAKNKVLENRRASV